MADKRWGSVKPYRDKWRARARGGEYIGLYDTEDEAWRKVDAWRRTEQDTAPDTLRRFGDAWLDDRETAGIIRGVKIERSVWRQHIETAAFIDWPMRRIKPLDVQRWLGQLVRKEARSTITGKGGSEHRKTGRRLSRQTVTHARRVLHSCFEQARIEGKVPSNPAAGVPVPKVERVIEDEDSWAWLTQEEIDRLLATVPTTRLRAFYAVAIYAGLRDGELLGLRWQDVVFAGERSCVKVRRSMDGPTKTRGSRRDVPLLPVAREALRAWQREGGLVRARGLVFGADHGGCHAKGYDGGWPDKPTRQSGELVVHEGWRSKAKIRDHVRFHDLRHTCASHLVMGTWTARPLTLYEAMQWLGHADIKTTTRYTHLAPGGLFDAAFTKDNTARAGDQQSQSGARSRTRPSEDP